MNILLSIHSNSNAHAGRHAPCGSSHNVNPHSPQKTGHRSISHTLQTIPQAHHQAKEIHRMSSETSNSEGNTEGLENQWTLHVSNTENNNFATTGTRIPEGRTKNTDHSSLQDMVNECIQRSLAQLLNSNNIPVLNTNAHQASTSQPTANAINPPRTHIPNAPSQSLQRRSDLVAYSIKFVSWGFHDYYSPQTSMKLDLSCLPSIQLQQYVAFLPWDLVTPRKRKATGTSEEVVYEYHRPKANPHVPSATFTAHCDSFRTAIMKMCTDKVETRFANAFRIACNTTQVSLGQQALPWYNDASVASMDLIRNLFAQPEAHKSDGGPNAILLELTKWALANSYYPLHDRILLQEEIRNALNFDDQAPGYEGRAPKTGKTGFTKSLLAIQIDTFKTSLVKALYNNREGHMALKNLQREIKCGSYPRIDIINGMAPVLPRSLAKFTGSIQSRQTTPAPQMPYRRSVAATYPAALPRSHTTSISNQRESNLEDRQSFMNLSDNENNRPSTSLHHPNRRRPSSKIRLQSTPTSNHPSDEDDMIPMSSDESETSHPLTLELTHPTMQNCTSNTRRATNPSRSTADSLVPPPPTQGCHQTETNVDVTHASSGLTSCDESELVSFVDSTPARSSTTTSTKPRGFTEIESSEKTTPLPTQGSQEQESAVPVQEHVSIEQHVSTETADTNDTVEEHSSHHTPADVSDPPNVREKAVTVDHVEYQEFLLFKEQQRKRKISDLKTQTVEIGPTDTKSQLNDPPCGIGHHPSGPSASTFFTTTSLLASSQQQPAECEAQSAGTKQSTTTKVPSTSKVDICSQPTKSNESNKPPAKKKSVTRKPKSTVVSSARTQHKGKKDLPVTDHRRKSERSTAGKKKSHDVSLASSHRWSPTVVRERAHATNWRHRQDCNPLQLVKTPLVQGQQSTAYRACKSVFQKQRNCNVVYCSDCYQDYCSDYSEKTCPAKKLPSCQHRPAELLLVSDPSAFCMREVYDFKTGLPSMAHRCLSCDCRLATDFDVDRFNRYIRDDTNN